MYNVHIGTCYTAIYFKSNLDRGGFIRNVHVSDIVVDHCKTAFVRFENNYHGARGGFHPTRFEDFHISNVRGGISDECGFYAVGIEGYPIRNVTMENVVLDSCKVPYTLAYTEGILFKDVRIGEEMLPERPASTDPSQLGSAPDIDRVR